MSSPHPNFELTSLPGGLVPTRLREFSLLNTCDEVTSDPWQEAGLVHEAVAISTQIPSICPNSCLLLRMLKLSEVSPKMKSLKRECHSLRMSVPMLSL